MASNSEKGHARLLANLNQLNLNIAALGADYNPSNESIKLNKLKELFENGSVLQKKLNELQAPYTLAVDNREEIFIPFLKQITKIKKAYFSTSGVDKAQKNDFMTISRKLKGIKKYKSKKKDETNDEVNEHSISQMSYDQRTNNMDFLISLLQNTPNYNPNETEYQISFLSDLKTKMLLSTNAVAETFLPYVLARRNRNDFFYHNPDSIVESAIKARDYLYSIIDKNSPQYIVISKLRFQKVL